MNFVAKTVVAVGLMTLATPVSAVELTNSEQTPMTITVVQDGKETAHTIGADETLKGVCMNACVIKLADGQEYAMDGNEVAFLEDGYIYVDDPDQQYAADDSSSQEEMSTEEEAPSDEEQAGEEEQSGEEEAPVEEESSDQEEAPKE